VWLVARRGYGPSDVLDRVKSFADEVADVREVLAAVRAETGRAAHLVGSSYGATLALHAAIAVPPDIATLSVYEPPLFAAGAELRPLLEDFRWRLAAGDLEGAMSLLPRVSRVPPAVLAAITGASSEQVPPAEVERTAVGWLHDLEAMAGDTTDIKRWAAVRIPTLLLQGADSWDPIPATMDELARALPRAEQTVWPGQSHFATSAAPPLVAATLRDFFRRYEEGR
jgi:pimeloyl-ACP methyl ester carboxylesterase